ncbi:MAG: hypothetical protein U1E27_01695 [Kiritimatiellia bacterium]|nr:hypothetical protein [Kiritimatiellia bacterium]
MNSFRGNVWARIGHPLFLSALLILLLAGVMQRAIRETRKADAEPGFAMDDAWIHATMARNLISGKGYGINAGEWIPLSTAPAWTLLLAVCMTAIRQPVAAGMFAAFLCQAAAMILMYFLCLRLTRHRFWSLVPPILMMLNPILLWGFASGMELPIVALAVTLCLFVFDRTEPDSRGRIYGLPLALLLGAMSRPELFVLAPLGLLATAYQNFRRGGGRHRIARVFGTQSLVYLVGVLPYFLFNLATTGHPFPTAFVVKFGLRDAGLFAALAQGDWGRVTTMVTRDSVEELYDVIRVFLSHNLLLVLLAPLGLITFLKPFREKEKGLSALLVSITLVLPLILGIVSPTDKLSNYANRYMAPHVPGLALMGGLGLWAIWNHCRHRMAALLCLILVAVAARATFKPTLQMYGRDVRNTNELYVESGQWLRDHLDPALPIGINDIGGISFFIENKVIDVMGLATPEIWPLLRNTSRDGYRTPERAQAIADFLRARNVEYLVISPKYYPELVRSPEIFEPVRTWNSPFATGRLISPQILYRIHWPAARAAEEADRRQNP